MSSLGDLFARMTGAEAAELLLEHYGVDADRLTPLDTERDDTFRVDADGRRFVLKVAHPDDDPLYVNLQTAAMAFAAEDPELPVQSVLLSREGEIEPVVSVGGRSRVARVLTWLDGTPLHEVQPDDGQLLLLGETLGRLTSVLSGFEHPAAHRDFVWDSARLDLSRDLLDEFPMEETRAAFELFDRSVAPRLATLPRHPIHNDFHPGNVLVDPGSERYVAGIIDFGDVVSTARVVDLAVALSYLRYPGSHSEEELDRFVEGFGRHVTLSDDEVAVLPGLVAARFAERILVNLGLDRGHPGDRGNVVGATEGTRRALGALLEKES